MTSLVTSLNLYLCKWPHRLHSPDLFLAKWPQQLQALTYIYQNDLISCTTLTYIYLNDLISCTALTYCWPDIYSNRLLTASCFVTGLVESIFIGDTCPFSSSSNAWLSSSFREHNCRDISDTLKKNEKNKYTAVLKQMICQTNFFNIQLFKNSKVYTSIYVSSVQCCTLINWYKRCVHEVDWLIRRHLVCYNTFEEFPFQLYIALP